MLVLSRKVGEKVQIGDGVTLTILKVAGTTVSLGIEAPRDVSIMRHELMEGQPGRPTDSVGPQHRANSSPAA